MSKITAEQLAEFVRELVAERDAEIAAVTAEIRRNYDTHIEFLKKRQSSSGSGTTRTSTSSPSPSRETVNQGIFEPKPEVVGAIALAARQYIEARKGTFGVIDVSRAVAAKGISHKREAVTAVIKRMLKKGDLRRVREGSTKVPALFEYTGE